jgi:hypothetical protein
VFGVCVLWSGYVTSVVLRTGIGDADTAVLSSLAMALGEDRSAHYGITEVSECDTVFQLSSGAKTSISLVLPTGQELAFSFITEDNESSTGGVVQACLVIEDRALVDQLHSGNTSVLSIRYDGADTSLVGHELAVSGADGVGSMQELLSALSQVGKYSFTQSHASFSRVTITGIARWLSSRSAYMQI